MLTIDVNSKQAGNIISRLNLYRAGVAENMDEVLATGALLIETDAKLFSPVDTGNNRASIHAIKVGYLSYKVAAQAKYAVFLEYGTVKMAAQPFMNPAYQKNKQEILADMKLALKYKKQ